MKRLLILAATFGGLIMTSIYSQAQALISVPGQMKDKMSDPLQQVYFDDYKTMRAYALIPWYDASVGVKPGSHVYTASGEEQVWPFFELGAPRPALAKQPWNHDGQVFANFVPRPPAISTDSTSAYQLPDGTVYRRNVKSGKWKEFKNGESRVFNEWNVGTAGAE